LVFYIKGDVVHLGFPKGKPNQDKKIDDKLIDDESNREVSVQKLFYV
jgi:hypothetical protein